MQADSDLVSEIRAAALSVASVDDVETLWVRKSGLEFLADIQFEADQHLTIAEGHRIGHRVKERLLTEFPSLRDVPVHLEPFPHTRAAPADEPPDSPQA